MSHDIRANITDVVDHIMTGRLLEGFEKYYHDDVEMSENNNPDPNRKGKAANRGYETYFVNNAKFLGARLGRILVDGDTSGYEMWLDFEMGGNRMTHWQFAIQKWQDGKIIHETFYYTP